MDGKREKSREHNRRSNKEMENTSGGQKWEQWIDIKKGFLQGDTYSPVGFLCTEIPATMLLEESDGYPMGSPSKREIERSRSLIIDDLKTYH